MNEIPRNTKIDIYSHIVKSFRESGINDNLQPFVNHLLESYFKGEIIILNPENQKYISSLTTKDKLDRNSNEIVNDLLDTIEIEPEKKEKIKIIIPSSKTNKIKIIKKQTNWVKNY
jgi:hypothetical protein